MCGSSESDCGEVAGATLSDSRLSEEEERQRKIEVVLELPEFLMLHCCGVL